MIDWTAAPEGTTHATIPSGDPRWYKLAGGKVLCWATRLGEWSPSFFLTVDEIAETGLCLYANGEQSDLVMLREQRDALLAASEWPDELVMEFIAIAFRHAQIRGDFQNEDVRTALKFIQNKVSGANVSFMERS